MINITQDDYDIIKQPVQTRYIKLNILDFQFRTVDEISGYLTEATFNIDANSDIRRSCNLNLIVYGKDAKKLNIESGAEIFLDKFLQPYIGIENMRTGKIQWYNQGIYLINRPTWDWDSQNNTLKFDGIDLMSKLTGERNGQLEGIPTLIPAGSNVREAMIASLALGGFTRYICSECQYEDGTIQDVPNDISIAQGNTIYNILSQLRDILPMYQIYFDVNGVFHYEPIPSGKNEQVMLDDDLIRYVLVSESINTEFNTVKNYIEVYGRAHDVQFYSSTFANNQGNITLTIGDMPEYQDNVIVGFTTDEAINGNVTLNINGLGSKRLVNMSGEQITQLDGDVYYVATYQQTQDTFLFMGHNQAVGIAYDDNPESPFYVNGPVGRIRYVCYGGDYDNIQSDELAQQRAQYELYLRDRLQDTISLYIVPIPWLDVNMLIRHTAKDDTLPKEYMIQSISYSMGEGNAMSIIANQYYPLYQ